MNEDESFHVTNLGSYGTGFSTDQSGYVHLTAAAVRAAAVMEYGGLEACEDGDFEDAVLWEDCEDIARKNREALARALEGLEAWQRGEG